MLQGGNEHNAPETSDTDMAKPSIFTLAPADHPTDLLTLERTCYKVWSTYRRHGNRIDVRTNQENAGGQTWALIARRTRNGWQVESGRGLLGQGGMLLARYLDQRGENVACEIGFHNGAVKRYRATLKAYSLPTLLNGRAVLDRDAEADKRSAERKGVDMAARLKEIQAERAAKAAKEKAKKEAK
jgi:hypothetical protein